MREAGEGRPRKESAPPLRWAPSPRLRKGPALPRPTPPSSSPRHPDRGQPSTFSPVLSFGSLVRLQTPEQSSDDGTLELSPNPNRGKSAALAASRPPAGWRADAPSPVTCAAKGLRQLEALKEQHEELRRAARGGPARPHPEPALPGARAQVTPSLAGAPNLPHQRPGPSAPGARWPRPRPLSQSDRHEVGPRAGRGGVGGGKMTHKELCAPVTGGTARRREVIARRRAEPCRRPGLGVLALPLIHRVPETRLAGPWHCPSGWVRSV